jgi:hypothetical protein
MSRGSPPPSPVAPEPTEHRRGRLAAPGERRRRGKLPAQYPRRTPSAPRDGFPPTGPPRIEPGHRLGSETRGGWFSDEVESRGLKVEVCGSEGRGLRHPGFGGPNARARERPSDPQTPSLLRSTELRRTPRSARVRFLDPPDTRVCGLPHPSLLGQSCTPWWTAPISPAEVHQRGGTSRRAKIATSALKMPYAFARTASMFSSSWTASLRG